MKISYKDFYGIFDGVRSYPISWGNFGHWNLLGFSTPVNPFRTKIYKVLPLRTLVQMKKTSGRNIHPTSHKKCKRLKSVRSYPGWRYYLPIMHGKVIWRREPLGGKRRILVDFRPDVHCTASDVENTFWVSKVEFFEWGSLTRYINRNYTVCYSHNEL